MLIKESQAWGSQNNSLISYDVLSNVTALLSPVFRLARKWTQPEVKFDTVIHLLCREEKITKNVFGPSSSEKNMRI